MVAFTRLKRRLAGPAFNTRSRTIRQPVEARERISRRQLFQFAQSQLATIRGLQGAERDEAYEELFLELWVHKRLLTCTWLRAYIRIAAANLDVPAAAAFILLCASH
jgi:hypothetical protein